MSTTKVTFECPHCKTEVVEKYGDFCIEVGEPCDWKYSKIECPECEKELEIDNAEWN